MAPFRDFNNECGEVDEYVESIDILLECRETYLSEQGQHVLTPDGHFLNPFDGRFWRDETDDEYNGRLAPALEAQQREILGGASYFRLDPVSPGSNKPGNVRQIFELPSGHNLVRKNATEVFSFKDWLQRWYSFKTVTEKEEPDLLNTHKFGWIRVDENNNVIEVVERTIPGGFWMWWSVGYSQDPATWILKKDYIAPDIFHSKDEEPGCTFCARKGDLDIARIRNDAALKAKADWDSYHTGNHRWEELRKRNWADNFYQDWSFDENRRLVFHTRDKYIEHASATAFFVGDMIMNKRLHSLPFSNESAESRMASQDIWFKFLNDTIDSLPDDTLLTHVVCGV